MRIFKIVIVLIAIFSAQLHVGNAMETMSADEIQAGMTGIAKTVIEGSTIDEFSVEIVGVLNDSPKEEGYILAKVSGDAIDKTGGVLQGMSGSPVYINGKLIGAISGGWKDIDNKLCLITPINEMLKIWNLPDDKNIRQSHVFKFNDSKVKKEDNKNSETNIKENKILESSKLLTGPLMASGFTIDGLQMLNEKLKPFNITAYNVSSGGTGNDIKVNPITLEPGSAIASEIVRGDISLAAIGTVTAVEGDKVLAFGHPFLRRGNVSYFMTDAKIIGTATGVNNGFKIGEPGYTWGLINQDRTMGIAGKIGQMPYVIPLRVQIYDKDLDVQKNYSAQIAYDEEIAPAVSTSVLYNFIDKTIDRSGPGTAKIEFEILTRGIKDKNSAIVRENMFYNLQDIGQLAVAEFFDIMNVLSNNKFNPVDILDVKVKIEVEGTRKTATIIEAKPDKTSAKPGDTVNIALKIKPYRSEEVTKIIPYKIDKNQAKGVLNLEVRGGGLIPLPVLLLKQQGIDIVSEENKNRTLEKIVADFEDSGHNNEVIIDILPPLQQPGENTGVKTSKKVTKIEKTNNSVSQNMPLSDKKVRASTDYIIENVVETAITVI